MGRGLALQFKLAFPGNFEEYQKACKRKDVTLGKMFVAKVQGAGPVRAIINFPIKSHFRYNSRLEDIRSGLQDLVHAVRKESIGSIAIPALGCGLGHLRWEDVKPEIVRAFEELPDVQAILFPSQE